MSSLVSAGQRLAKAPSGIEGLDEITNGGLPLGRPTLVCGGAGCGKTLFGVQFLVSGMVDHGEPGVFMSFEESAAEIEQNVRALGWDLAEFERQGLLALEHVRIDPAEMAETGGYDLEGLFIRLGLAIDSVGATRVVLDTLEVLFSAFKDQVGVRAELRRLFRWLKDRGVTAIITAERGDGSLTRHGLEEYVSDCVILLDHRIVDQLSTRRLRVVKYRGSAHVSDEAPFLIDEGGIRALPLTSLRLEHDAPMDRLSSGVERIDAMLGGEGYFRGSSALITGTAGCGKTALAAAFVAASCTRGERALLFAFEESPRQLARNLRSMGIDLAPHLESGLLRIVATRPSAYGLEAHLSTILSEVVAFSPDVIVVDPLTAFGSGSVDREAMFTRLVDFFKARAITAVYTSLIPGGGEALGTGISSVIDTWLSLTSVERDGERNRGIRVVKSRGMGHSKQVRELLLTERGIELADVYTGSAGVLLGTARRVQEAADANVTRLQQDLLATKRREFERQAAQIPARLAALQAELEGQTEQLLLEIRAAELRLTNQERGVADIARAREADAPETVTA